MNGIDILILAVIALILGASVYAIYRSKKSGKKCIGCPDSHTCGGACSGKCSGCTGTCSRQSN